MKLDVEAARAAYNKADSKSYLDADCNAAAWDALAHMPAALDEVGRLRAALAEAAGVFRLLEEAWYAMDDEDPHQEMLGGVVDQMYLVWERHIPQAKAGALSAAETDRLPAAEGPKEER